MGNEIRMFVPTAEKQTYRDVQQTGGSIGVREDGIINCKGTETFAKEPKLAKLLRS